MNIQQIEDEVSLELTKRKAEGFKINSSVFWINQPDNKQCCAIGAVNQDNGEQTEKFAARFGCTKENAADLSEGFIAGSLYGWKENPNKTEFHNLGIRLAKKHCK